MASYLLFLFLSLLFSSTKPSTSKENDYSCSTDLGSPTIRFPFGLNTNQTTTYPGFTLKCNNLSQTIITLPRAGKFVVEGIIYESQTIFIKDPKDCLPRRFLKGFSLVDSPFTTQFHRNFTFLSCPSNFNTSLAGLRIVPCLSDYNYTVVAFQSNRLLEFTHAISSCNGTNFSSVVVPVIWPPWSDADTSLSWNVPDCRSCESQGGTCGFNSGGLNVGCSNLPHKGLTRTAKYGIIFGIGIPGVLCIIGVACWLSGKLKRRRPQRNANFSVTSMVPQQSIIVSGLDRPTIETYPKTIIGESKRLPNSNDTICPICLSEYEPKETLRTIPECNHYFHAECIDEWLKMNATCPLCRNTPEASSRATPASSLSLSSSSSSLSPTSSFLHGR